jgi:hypothetical protein
VGWCIPVITGTWRLRWKDHLSPGVQDQPRQYSKTPSQDKNFKKKRKMWEWSGTNIITGLRDEML